MDDELNLATAQGQNTFQGTKPASLQQPLKVPTPVGKNLQQSDQGAIMNRFKDSIEANPMDRVSAAP
jgi:hypothetical protein